MPVYLVTPLGSNFDQIGKSLADALPKEDVVVLQHRAGYLVRFQGTSVDLSHKIGISSPDPEVKPTIGSALVTGVGSYYGRGSSTMWEWLKIQFER